MLGEVFGLDGLVALVFIAAFVLSIWALIDACIRPTDAFKAAGQNKALWVILPIVGLLLFTVIGGVAGVVYLTVIKPKVQAAQG